MYGYHFLVSGLLAAGTVFMQPRDSLLFWSLTELATAILKLIMSTTTGILRAASWR